jgi:AcrR family transcriptional regulator
MWALSTYYTYDVARVNMVASYFGAQDQEPFAQEWWPVKANVADVNTLDIMRRRKMSRPKPYHHGNLREALLEAAIRLIAEVGPTAFTLREVARRAGVSHNAPYRHFRDRDDLMAAVAAEGFRELTQAMVESAGQRSDALDQLKRAGLGYVTFALRRPEHFTVMFDAPLSKRNHPDSAAAAEQAFGTLMSFVKGCQDAGRLPSGDLRQMALLAWTMVHGIAKLAIAGRLPFRSNAEVVKFAEFVIDQSLSVGQ